VIFTQTQEDLMQIGNPRSSAKSTTPDDLDDLLDCRIAMLGLDLDAVESVEGYTFDAIRRRCESCGYREACAVDLTRDPNNPVWETYCPNSYALIGLAHGQWLTS
jgi:hypothetical protein